MSIPIHIASLTHLTLVSVSNMRTTQHVVIINRLLGTMMMVILVVVVAVRAFL